MGKDLFYKIVLGLVDPEFKAWAREIVDMVGYPDEAGGVHPEDVHEAIENPTIFMAEIERGESALQDAFIGYLSKVERESQQLGDAVARRFDLRSRSFVGRLNLFNDSAVSALKMHLHGKANRFRIYMPSDEDLARFYVPDIAEGAHLVRSYISALRDAALGKGLREFLDDVDEEFEQFELYKEKLDPEGPEPEAPDSEDLGSAGIRRRIWEMEWMFAGAFALLRMSKEGFRRQSGEIADGLEARLGEVPADSMHVASSHIKIMRACLAAGATDGRLRDVAVEAHIVLADLMFTSEYRERGNEPVTFESDFEDISSFAYGIIDGGIPEIAMAAVMRVTKDARMAGAALLDAAFRYRFRDSTSPFLQTIAPILKRTQMMDVSSSKGEEGGESASGMNQHTFSMRFPEILRRGVPIQLEFGGGWSPYSWELAHGRPRELFISIDSDEEPVKENFHYMGDLPENFMQLVGRAEDVAPFAASAPFAEGAMMVAPPSTHLNAMFLSALLAVKPGGFVNVYMDIGISNDLDWLADTGFDVVETRLASDDPTLPPSERFAKYEGVRHVRVTVGDLDGDGTDPSDGKGGGFRGVMRSQGGSDSSSGSDNSQGSPDGREIDALQALAGGGVAALQGVSVVSAGLATGMGVLKLV